MKTIGYILLFLMMALTAQAEDLYEPKPSRFVQPSFIVLPDTEVYVAPEVAEYDLFWWNGWFWQKYGVAWWKTRSWNTRWTCYHLIPKFLKDVPLDWRARYMSRSWDGKPWKPKLIPYSGLEQYQRALHQKRLHEKRKKVK
jgi:hypothetical protein